MISMHDFFFLLINHLSNTSDKSVNNKLIFSILREGGSSDTYV